MTPRAAFADLNRIAGIAPLSAPRFEGADPVIPTPFRAATAAAAALGLSAAVAAEIWRLRGGERQAVAVDLRAAAASLKGFAFVKGCGGEALGPRPTMGFYQSADGRWLHLHGGFPLSAARMRDLLNAEDTREAVMEGVAKWNGFALEDAMAFMGLSCAVVRSEEEWRASAQGRALAGMPPIVLTRIGDAPPLRLAASKAPLAGLHVLDLTRALAGPAAARELAWHGAEVLHVAAERIPTVPLFDCDTEAGKRSAFLDLAQPGDAERLRQLVRGADVFVDSYRPGALAKLGFSPAALAHVAPGIVYVAVSAYGGAGPWAERRGFEEQVEAATGLAAEQGALAAQRRGSRRESLPERLPAPVCDYLTGYLAAVGAQAALLRRIREGGSWLVQTSLAQTAQWLQSLGRAEPGDVPERWDLSGLDPYLKSCETEAGRLECLGPVVTMSLTPPVWRAPPSVPGGDAPVWRVHEGLNAAEAQSA